MLHGRATNRPSSFLSWWPIYGHRQMLQNWGAGTMAADPGEPAPLWAEPAGEHMRGTAQLQHG